MFKIRDIDTGKFSTGGCYPKWNNNGKVWSHIGHLKNHLHLYDYKNINAVVVEYTMLESGTITVKDFIG